jgi:hypothetical protein
VSDPDSTTAGRARPRGDIWPTPVVVALVVIAAVAMAAGIVHFGNIQFAGEDGGIASVLGWQLATGDRPYVQTPRVGLPPIFVVGLGWAFGLFGAHWSSLVTLTALACALGLIALAGILHRAGSGSAVTVLLPVTTAAVTFLPISFWWYNQLTAVSAALLLAVALLFHERPEDRVAQVCLFATAVLMSWGKANSAGLLLAGVAIIVTLSPRTRRRGLALLLGAGAASLALLLLSGVDVVSMLRDYTVGGSRLLTPGFFSVKSLMFDVDSDEVRLTFLALAPAVVALVGTVIAAARRPRPGLPGTLVALCLLGVATGIVAMGTNNDHNMVEVPVMLVGITWLARAVHRARRPRDNASRGAQRSDARSRTWERASTATISALLLVSMLALTSVGVTLAIERRRVESSGMGTFYQDAPLTRLAQPAYFEGLQAGPALAGTIGQLDDLLGPNGWVGRSDAPVYFGPRILWAYPAFGIRMRPGLPLWWERFPDGLPRTVTAVRAWRDAHYEMALVYMNDYLWLPGSLMKTLFNDYEVYVYKDFVVHVSKTADPRPVVPPGTVPFQQSRWATEGK